MPLSPIKLLTAKLKSPTTSSHSKGSSSHRSSDRRSRSYDPARRPSRDGREEHTSSSRRRASYARPRSPDPYPSSRPSRHERHSRRRDSSESSPEPRYSRPPPRDRDEYLSAERWEDDRGRRRASLAPPERDERPPLSGRPSSVDYRRRPSQSRRDSTSGGYTYEARDDPRLYERRPSVQGKYRSGERYSNVDSPPVSPGRRESLRSPRIPRDDTPPRSSRPHASPRPSDYRPYEYRPHDQRNDSRHDQRPHEAPPRPHSQSVDSAAKPATSSGSNLFASMPAAIAAYAGLKEVSKHAETAKEWVDWLNEMSETPDEIQELSAQAATARDTINQVQLTLKARPDLVEGEQGEKLKGQIETSIKNTDKALEKMTKLLSEISSEGTSASGQTAINQMQSFWRSYRYKNDFEQQVKKAQEDVQKELSALSTLMVNIYSRALMKPPPPGASPIPPPAPTPAAPSPEPSAKANAAPVAQPLLQPPQLRLPRQLLQRLPSPYQLLHPLLRPLIRHSLLPCQPLG
uniref:Uncharacterized protein n=1 Tax=Bionectria ochroleuca TaxID=29856 RepID=A0A8H7NC52_BIOOC